MSDVKSEGVPGERLVYVMPQAQPEMAMDDEIDLFELWETIWSGKILIAAIAAVFTIGGVGYGFSLPEVWKAEVSLSQADSSGGMSSAMGRFGGLAALAGVDIGVTGASEAKAVLGSRAFVREFIIENDLVPTLQGNALPPNGQRIDMRDAVAAFQSLMEVTEESKSGLMKVSITWTDPEIAASWANKLVDHLNERMRRKALDEAERNVTYLQKEIASTTVVAMQQTMGRVLEGEMQKLMLARGNAEFAFKVIDPAVPPKTRESPKRSLIAIVSMFAGGFLGILVVFIRKVIAKRPVRAQS